MLELYRRPCITCRHGDPSLSFADIIRWHREIPRWEIKQVGGIQRLERAFVFRDFSEAMAFTVNVAALAERENHHPSILIEYDQVTLNFWTHKVRGLHLNDFIMAAKVDDLIGPQHMRS